MRRIPAAVGLLVLLSMVACSGSDASGPEDDGGSAANVVDNRIEADSSVAVVGEGRDRDTGPNGEPDHSDRRMTVEEYATACGTYLSQVDVFDAGDLVYEDTGEVLDSVNTVMASMNESLDSLDDTVAIMRSWNPPEELEKLHEARLAMAEGSLDYLQNSGIRATLNEAQALMQSEDFARIARLDEGFSQLTELDSDEDIDDYASDSLQGEGFFQLLEDAVVTQRGGAIAEMGQLVGIALELEQELEELEVEMAPLEAAVLRAESDLTPEVSEVLRDEGCL